MRRLSQRESVLLGYSPQKAFPIADTCSEDTDVDFSDVFGGPPRRSSLHEMRFSLGESSDCSGLTSDGDKPVFGDEGLNRRRYQNDKFFDDIFGGNEPPSSSPRRSFRDPFCSSPGSRVLSPARPLPPKAEPFGSSLPAPFSLPAKLSIGMEPPAFGSPTRASNRGKDAAPNGLSNYSLSPLSRSSSQVNHDQEESKHDGQSSYLHRALSQEVSCGSEVFSNSIKHDREQGADNSRKDSNGSEVLNSSSQFHFSIYKWASKGVPLSLAFRGGNTSKLKPKDGHERSFRSEGWTGGEENVKESPSLVSSDDANSVFDKKSGKSFRMGNQKENDTLSDKSLGDKQQCKTVEEILPTSKLEASSSSHTVKNIFDGGVSESVQETASDSLLQTDIHDQPGKGIPIDMEEVRKPQGKSLSLLFYENTGCKGNEDIAGKDSQEGNKSKNKKKSSMVPDDAKNFKEDRSKTNVSNEEIGKIWTQGQPYNSGDHGQSNAKGKVKDFVKMFNQESSTKQKLEKVSQSRSSSWKEKGASRTENEASTSTTETDKNESMSNMRNRKSSPDVSFKVDGFAHRTSSQCSTVNDTNHLHADVSKQKNSSTSAAASNGSNNSALDADGSFEDSFTIKEITHDDKKVPHISFKAEELLVIDTKIRQWSHEKQGNIRSLLSTLQYVLWPDSGWKPVPLVDIIEGNAVKRSYQKALLCLHPDKLQQKGATLQQKYTAEKVFDILQDAWTHFSSVGLM